MLQRNLFKKAKTERHSTTGETLEDKRCPKLITSQESKDVVSVVAQFLTPQDFANVSKACRGSRALFKSSKSITVSTNNLHQLLQAIVYGDMKEAEKIINTDPTLLLKSGTVTDYSGRTHSNRTAFQLALGACDYHVRDAKGNIVVSGMVEKLETLFQKIPGETDEEIREMMRDQYVGQFPEGHEVLEAKRMAEDSAALNAIMNVIADLKDEKECAVVSTLEDKIHKIRRKEESERADQLRKLVQDMLKAASKDPFEKAFEAFMRYLTDTKLLTPGAVNIDLLKALYQFRWYLESKDHQTTGKHFNHQLLIDAIELSDKNYKKFGNHWDSPKNLFCFQKVFGGIERYVPACDAQSIAYDLSNLFIGGRESTRSLNFRYSEGKYYPLTDHPIWEFGYNCAGRLCRESRPLVGVPGLPLLSNLMSSKNNSARSYAAAWTTDKEMRRRDKVIALR